MEGVDAWLCERLNRHSCQFQKSLGWEPFLYGFLDNRWRQQQAQYKPPAGAKALKPEIWAKKLIEFFWQKARSVWDQRNDEVHDTSSQRAIDYVKQQLEAEVRSVFAAAEQMSAFDRQMLEKITVEELLNKPISFIKRWVKRNKSTVKFCVRDQQERIAKSSTDIRSYFMQATITDENNNNVAELTVNTLALGDSKIIWVCYRCAG